MQERTSATLLPRLTVWERLLGLLLLGGPHPDEHRDSSYRPMTAHQGKVKARNRAANKVARRSRRINRLRGR